MQCPVRNVPGSFAPTRTGELSPNGSVARAHGQTGGDSPRTERDKYAGTCRQVVCGPKAARVVEPDQGHATDRLQMPVSAPPTVCEQPPKFPIRASHFEPRPGKGPDMRPPSVWEKIHDAILPNIEKLVKRAVAEALRGKYKDALGLCNRALKLDPNDIAALTWRAIALRMLHSSYCVDDFARVLEMQPDNRLARVNRAAALYYWESLVARDDVAIVLAKDPRDQLALLCRALLATTTRSIWGIPCSYEAAIADLESILQINPTNEAALSALLYTLDEQRNDLRAENVARRILDLNPSSAAARYFFAMRQSARTGDYDEPAVLMGENPLVGSAAAALCLPLLCQDPELMQTIDS